MAREEGWAASTRSTDRGRVRPECSSGKRTLLDYSLKAISIARFVRYQACGFSSEPGIRGILRSTSERVQDTIATSSRFSRENIGYEE
jgi:hypothetical protein